MTSCCGAPGGRLKENSASNFDSVTSTAVSFSEATSWPSAESRNKLRSDFF